MEAKIASLRAEQQKKTTLRNPIMNHYQPIWPCRFDPPAIIPAVAQLSFLINEMIACETSERFVCHSERHEKGLSQ